MGKIHVGAEMFFQLFEAGELLAVKTSKTRDSGSGEKVNADNNTPVLALCKSCISNALVSKPGDTGLDLGLFHQLHSN